MGSTDRRGALHQYFGAQCCRQLYQFSLRPGNISSAPNQYMETTDGTQEENADLRYFLHWIFVSLKFLALSSTAKRRQCLCLLNNSTFLRGQVI